MGAPTLLPALLMGCGLVAASHFSSRGMYPSVTAVAVTEYVYTADHAIITLNESTKTVGNTVMIMMPATTVVPFGLTPNEGAAEAHLIQEILELVNDANGNMDAFHSALACNDLPHCRKTYDYLDWQEKAGNAGTLAPYLDGDTDRATRFALLHALQRRRKTFSSTTIVGPPPTITAEVAVVPGTAGSPTTISRFPATVGHTVYAHNTTFLYDYAWAAQQTKIPDPPSCHGTFRNKTLCHYQKCMLKHFKPMNMTTVFQAAKFSAGCTTLNVHNPWYTQPTSLTTPHWGTTQQDMLYYPHTPTVWSKKGTTHVAMATQKPAHDEQKKYRVLNAMGPPSCWDRHTCCAECWTSARSGGWLGSLRHPFNFHKALAYFALLGLLGLLASLLTCLLCCIPRWRSRRERRKRAEEELAKREKITVVDPAPGVETVVVTSTPGQAIDPATAAAATGAAVVVANQGTTTGADPNDGRGTMARRAEEGRGHVQFAPPPANTVVTSTQPADPATGTGEKVTTTVTPAGAPAGAPADKKKTEQEKSANAAQQKAEVAGTPPVPAATAPVVTEQVAPVPVHDGVYDWPPTTGSQYADMGSMRGRKRGKPDGRGNLLNLGF